MSSKNPHLLIFPIVIIRERLFAYEALEIRKL